MGKLNHDPETHHFSHPHPLHLSQVSSTTASCSACKLPITTANPTCYTCTICNFSLHVSCTQFPELITHPSHPNHPLSLLPTTAYPEGHFKCDACKCRGNGFSYHCSQCYFDLHIMCASKPLSVTNPLHPHPLGLTFSSPYEKKGFSCDICCKIGTQQWFYRCVSCEFDVHLECVNTQPVAAPPVLQHQYSLPPQNQTQQLQGNQSPLVHSASNGGRLQNSYPPMAMAVEAPPAMHQRHHSSLALSQNQNQTRYGNQNHLIHSACTGDRLQNNYPPMTGMGPIYNGGNTNSENDLANTVVTTMVAPPLLHHHSLPSTLQNGNQILHGNQNHLMHSAITGGQLQNNYPPPAARAVAPPPLLHHHHSLPAVSQNRNQIHPHSNHLMHSASTGGRLQNYYPMAGAAAGVGTGYIGGISNIGNALANTTGIVQGAVQQVGLKFVQGAVQQAGESFMQSLIGGGGDSGGDIAVSVLGGVLDTLG